MKFALEIGEVEKHLLEYERDRLSGFWVIRIDGEEVKKSKKILFNPKQEVHTFDVGNSERLHVRIEIERGIWGNEKKRVFVNGRLVKLHQGADDPGSAQSEAVDTTTGN